MNKDKIVIPSGSVPIWRFEVAIPCGYRRDVILNCGPFTAEVHDKSMRSMCFRYTDSLFHFPEPNSKTQKYLSGGWFSGISNNNDLRLWMPSKRVLKDLYEVGFRLKLYSVKEKHVIEDNTQCAFKTTDASVVKEYTLEEALAEVYQNRDLIYLGTEDLIQEQEEDLPEIAL